MSRAYRLKGYDPVLEEDILNAVKADQHLRAKFLMEQEGIPPELRTYYRRSVQEQLWTSFFERPLVLRREVID